MQQRIPDEEIATMRAALLAFFDGSARPLPWRQTRDPYAIWVSEVMAQQTRVETVVPYYQRWLSRFPDVDTLADAPLDDVLKTWEGLGYYSRARNLHTAARLVRERHGSAVPGSFDALRALPGVGEYTAGAVSSIAFGARHAAVDGNARRVLCRVLNQPAPSPALLREVAGALVPDDRPGDFNQALMELGATICTPKAPRCRRCPVAEQCAARAAGTQEERPRRTPKRPVPTIEVATAVVCDAAGRLLLVRRPARGLLAGMWSFPGIEVQHAADPAAQAAAVAHQFVVTGDVRSAGPPADGLDSAAAPRPLGLVEHLFSHRRERYHCFIIEASFVGHAGHDIAWIDADDTERALPRAQQRIRSMALADRGRRESVRRGTMLSAAQRSSASDR